MGTERENQHSPTLARPFSQEIPMQRLQGGLFRG